MSKEYIPKQFTPFIYPEWGELFDELTDNQNAEILKAITKFPDYEPINIPVWKFIKSQLQKDYENFKAKCKKRGEASRTYWGNKGEQMISNDIKSLSKNNKGEPKPLTINHLPLTTNHLPLTETEIQTNMRGEYKNVYLPDNKLREFETNCLNKKLASDIICYLSEQIEQGKDEDFNSDKPNAHFVRLNQLLKVRRQHPEWFNKQEEDIYNPNRCLF